MGQHLFQADVVLPAVGQVVLVAEALAFAQPEVSEADLVRVIAEREAAAVRDAIVPPVNVEAMQVFILPAHGDLEDGVELGDGRVSAHQQPAPDERRDAAQ